MKQKLFIVIFLVLVAAVLVGLNAATYTQKEKPRDSESFPNRSTYNAGATGTLAFYSLLLETGRPVTRWQEPPAALLTSGAKAPAVMVIVGPLQREFKDIDIEQLLRWVSQGGRLVLIDREPPPGLVATTANWAIGLDAVEGPEIFTVETSDQNQMTQDTATIKGVQPSLFTQNVNAIQPSRFASSIRFESFLTTPVKDRDANVPPPATGSGSLDLVETPSEMAPMVHFAGAERHLLVDAPFGKGKIVFLSDPYIVSNGGIRLADNAQLAINLAAAGDGLVAFDEYHQGFGMDNNRFLQFFEGTPVIAIFLQVLVITGLAFFSVGRRFGRPVPEAAPDRLSKLEYVAAMAELQSRTKAFDLAVENIYLDFRRRAARYFGLDNFKATSSEIAALVAERLGVDNGPIEQLLFKCEEIVRGDFTTKHEVLHLVDALRSIEHALGMTRAVRTRI